MSRLLVTTLAGRFKVRFTEEKPRWRASGNPQWNSTALNVTNSFFGAISEYHGHIIYICRNALKNEVNTIGTFSIQ